MIDALPTIVATVLVTLIAKGLWDDYWEWRENTRVIPFQKQPLAAPYEYGKLYWTSDYHVVEYMGPKEDYHQFKIVSDRDAPQGRPQRLSIYHVDDSGISNGIYVNGLQLHIVGEAKGLQRETHYQSPTIA